MSHFALIILFFVLRWAMRESRFQREFIGDLKRLFPGCIVMKNDANYIQGIPDLLFLYKDKWAAFEMKRSANEHHQPNQDYYISLMDEMSFASFVYPENKEVVLDELQQALRPRGSTRFSKR